MSSLAHHTSVSASMVSVIYSEDFLLHDTGRVHPERPARLSAIVEALQAVPWANQIKWQLPTRVDQRSFMPLLTQVHDPAYIEEVKYIADRGGGYLTPDTPVSAQSYDVALLAISAWLDGVDLVITRNEPAFVLARPPGHHAMSEQGMGFCLFSNAAIAAIYALTQAGIQRVAILDWDVHHGNGTQAIVENHPQIAYCSLHQSPCYPGTGYENECGAYDNVLNIPMIPGSGSLEYQTAFETKVMPFLTKVQPDLLIVSAGYDANMADPLAQIQLLPQDFKLFTQYCLQIQRRILFGLEGGYDLSSLSQSVVATIEQCLL